MRLMTWLAMLVLATAWPVHAQTPRHHTPPACWSAPRITHGAWGEQPGERVSVSRAVVPAAEGTAWTMSPNAAYRLRKIDPDLTAPPPWNTRIVIEAERPEAVVVDLRNHGTATAYAVWVGIGVLGTVIFGVVLLGEPVNALRIVGILLLLAGIIALKLA